jgi:hypothetical protein
MLIDDARDGFQNGGFARAIGAQHRGNLTATHLQADAADGLDGAIRAFNVQQFQHRLIGYGRSHAASLRRLDTSSMLPR